MKSAKMSTIVVLALGLMVCFAQVSQAEPMGTAFTYQGRLMDKNRPAEGLYDFQFKLYDSNDPCTGTQLASPIDINDLDVIDGHFVVELDFGSGIFDGNAVWLETRIVRSPMGSDPAALSPMLELTPTPYAIYARTAGADSDWMVSGNDMYAIPSGKVGIGTSEPACRLHVNLGYGYVKCGGSSEGDILEGHFDGGGEGAGVRATLGGPPWSAAAYLAYDTPGGTFAGYFLGDVYASGNVGIGTTDPGAKLGVNGQIKITGGSPGANKVLTSNADGLASWQTPAPGGDSDWIISLNNMYSGVTGNVGIGTDSPETNAKLHAVTSLQDYSARAVFGESSFGYGVFGKAGTGQGVVGVSGSGKDPYERQIGKYIGVYGDGGDGYGGYFLGDVYASGNVGIGKTNPQEKLDVDGPINTDSVYKIAGDTVLSTLGTDNTFVGIEAGANNTGHYSTFVGQNAGYNNQGNSNTFVGRDAGYSNTTGYWNTFSGYNAGRSNSTGYNNTFLGYVAGLCNTTGYNNTFLGYRAGYFNTNGIHNTFVGRQAGNSNTTGNYNTFVGDYAGRSNTIGYNNTFLGTAAGYYNNGNSNTFVGRDAGYFNTTGCYNTFVGRDAGHSNTEGWGNTFLGHFAGYYNNEGNYNTFLGQDAGCSNSTGVGNVFIGYQAGYNERGSDRLYIANSSTSTPLIYGNFATNQIGINRFPATNTFEVEGNASKTSAGSWLANSDARIKADIQTVTNALEALDKVRLVSFKYTDDYQAKHPSIENRRYLNVVAQEFRQVFPEYVKSSKEKLTNGDEILQVDAYPLTVYSAAAVQELHEIVKAKDAEIAGLKERISRIEAVLAKLDREQEGGQR